MHPLASTSLACAQSGRKSAKRKAGYDICKLSLPPEKRICVFQRKKLLLGKDSDWECSKCSEVSNPFLAGGEKTEITPRIRAVVSELIKQPGHSGEREEELISRIFRYTIDSVKKVSIPLEKGKLYLFKRTADEILQDSFTLARYFCFDTITLFSALTRAAGFETAYCLAIHEDDGEMHAFAQIKVAGEWRTQRTDGNLTSTIKKTRPGVLIIKGKDLSDLGFFDFSDKYNKCLSIAVEESEQKRRIEQFMLEENGREQRYSDWYL